MSGPNAWIGGGLALAALLAISPALRQPEAPIAVTPVAAAANAGMAELAAVLPPEDPGVALDPIESTILAQRKRIMGKQRSLEMVARVANEVGQHVRGALELGSVQAGLADLAAGAGMPVADYKQFFAGKQEADLLLESGGDPNARSVSNAVGVAQFLAGTARGRGLKVNEGAARACARRMAALERQLDWLGSQPATWGKRGPAPRGKPAPFWTRDQWIAVRKSEWRRWEAKRRAADERLDPGKAIRAQTRYLVALTRRYGSVAWALQAYHGGEGGAARTINLYRWGSPSMSLAGGSLPPYEELYRRATPLGRSDAFYYLYGRSDDHRYYWWKVLMAERAIRLYRADSVEFRRQWQALKPGYRMEVAWYGMDPGPLAFSDRAALRRAAAEGTLVSVPGDLAARGIAVGPIAPLDRANAGDYKRLRPEAMGTLLQLAAIYRGHGGKAPLKVLSLVQTTEGARAWRSTHPIFRRPPLPLADPPVDNPDFHPTGLVFDVARPTGEWDRRVLEYALGSLYDRLRISWVLEKDEIPWRYHVAPNPTYAKEFRAALRG